MLRFVDAPLFAVTAIGAGTAALYAVRARRIPQVWRGETLDKLPFAPWMGNKLHHRSYIPYVASGFLFGTGMAVASLGLALNVRWLRDSAIACVLLMIASMTVWFTINVFNRPRFLVPPARRREHGGLDFSQRQTD